jgi:hypothetical protein
VGAEGTAAHISEAHLSFLTARNRERILLRDHAHQKHMYKTMSVSTTLTATEKSLNHIFSLLKAVPLINVMTTREKPAVAAN